MRSHTRLFFRRIVSGGSGLTLGLAIVGAVLRVTVRDRCDGLSTVFYATPWPVVGLLLLPSTSLWLLQRKWRLAAAAAAIVSVIATTWFMTNTHIPPRVEKRALRVVFFNAGRPDERSWHEMIAKIAEEKADLIGIVEAGSNHAEDLALLRTLLPEHSVRFYPNHLVLLVRGSVTDLEFRTCEKRNRFQVSRAQLDGRDITVILADLDSNPVKSRRRPMKFLDELAAAHGTESLIIMGDFNLPRESVYFDSWSLKFREAFDVAGDGRRETWPNLFPILSIDHVWTTTDLQAVRCSKRCHWASDHCALVTDFVEHR